MSHSVNQWVIQSISESFCHSVSHSVNQWAIQSKSFSQLVSHSVNQWFIQSFSGSFSHSVGQLLRHWARERLTYSYASHQNGLGNTFCLPEARSRGCRWVAGGLLLIPSPLLLLSSPLLLPPPLQPLAWERGCSSRRRRRRQAAVQLSSPQPLYKLSHLCNPKC